MAYHRLATRQALNRSFPALVAVTGCSDADSEVQPAESYLEPLSLLSLREREIALLVADGLSNKEIGGRLSISHWTVCTHMRRIFVKLEIGRRVDLLMLIRGASRCDSEAGTENVQAYLPRRRGHLR
jgi:DNA-binding CsgD family transcriptional regulator